MRYNNLNKYQPKVEKIEDEEQEEKKTNEVKLKSELYNHDNESLEKRDLEENSNAIMWGFVIGFILFLIIFILIITFIR